MPALKREGKRSRSKEANAESQRRFMERRREQEEVTNQLINTRFEELEISREERRKLDLEHQIYSAGFM